MRHYSQSIMIVIATLALLYLAWQLREASILFILSLMMAAFTRSPVNFWIKHGLPRGLAIILTYFLGLIFLGFLLYIVSKPVLDDLQLATNSFDQIYREIIKSWPTGSPFQQMIVEQLPPSQDLYGTFTGERGIQLLQNFLGIASGFMETIAKFGIVLVLSIYWSFDRLYFEWQWISLLHAEKRNRAREIWRGLEEGVGGYLRSELFQSVLAFLEIVVEPRIFNQKKYSSLLVVILLVAMAEAFGLVGMLMAPALAATVQTIFTSLMQLTSSYNQVDIVVKVESLRQRVLKVQEQVGHNEDGQSPEVVNLLGKLSKIMEQADMFFKSDAAHQTEA